MWKNISPSITQHYIGAVSFLFSYLKIPYRGDRDLTQVICCYQWETLLRKLCYIS